MKYTIYEGWTNYTTRVFEVEAPDKETARYLFDQRDDTLVYVDDLDEEPIGPSDVEIVEAYADPDADETHARVRAVLDTLPTI